jgi:5'-nucleotidase
MLILISNDDGVHATGIGALATELSRIARVIVVAPDREQSATSHALTVHRPLRVNKIRKDWYSVDGTPTDCVMLAVDGLMPRKPDLVISGINHGPNMGDDVLYSGTVAAAFEGFVQGITSIAVSQINWRKVDMAKGARFVRRFVQEVPELHKGDKKLLNMNLPPPGPRGLREFKITRLGHRVYKDVVSEKLDPRGRTYYWIAGQPVWDAKKDSDIEAVRKGMVSVTPIKMDYTHYVQFDEMQEWAFRKRSTRSKPTTKGRRRS